MENDFFAGSANSLTSPAEVCFGIAPNDFEDLPQVTKAIYVGQGGDVRLLPLRGTETVTFVNVASGSVLDVRARRILTLGTTATDMIGLV
jgi:hypothetical protein